MRILNMNTRTGRAVLAGVEQAAIALEQRAVGSASQDSFAELVERQSRFVFRVAYSVLRRVEDAEDAVQETFFKLYRNGQWKGVEDERGFLARAAWRVAVDRLPKRRSEEVREFASGEDVERAVVEKDWNAAVHRLIDALPEELRQPLALSAVEEMTSRQIAVVMGIPEGTVRSRLSRARGLLKEKLAVLMGRSL
jgi:RNA polymerase sigma-70 factor, ECF subfamily